ncbi:MAG: hypothetical protein WCG80_14875 [Spirochaetales bacterium]
MRHRFVGYDEGKQTLGLYDTASGAAGWTLDLAELPLARDLQRLGPDRVLVGFDRGYFEVEIASGRVMGLQDRWRHVTSVRRIDGRTLLTGLGLEGRLGVTVATLSASGALERVVRREGDYVRLMRPTPTGTFLLCTNDHILETSPSLEALRRLEAPGFLHAWMPHRFEDGTTLVSAGYGAFLARFDAQGKLLQTFGGKGTVPDEVAPFFYASFQVLEDGHIVAANWQDHGPGNGKKGRQVVEFTAEGEYVDSWSDPARISSLQGLLVL